MKSSLMNIAKVFCSGGLGLLIVGVGASVRGQETVPNNESVKETVWKPDAILMRYMGRQMPLLSYSLQPPASYTLHEVHREGQISYIWQGAGTIFPSNIAIVIAPIPMRGSKKVTSEQLLGSALDTLHRGYSEWKQTEIEYGQINGIAFVRAYWTGTNQAQKQKRRGVSYVALDGPNAISLLSQDRVQGSGPTGGATSPEGATTSEDPADDVLPVTVDRLKLAETAIQTLHRVTTPRKTLPVIPRPPAKP